MLYKINIRNIVYLLLFVFFLGCSEDQEYKADSIVGYWQVLQETSLGINGIPGTPYEKGYYIRFLDNNCGHLYDRDENWTNDIKWAFQERETRDDLFISTALNSSGQSTDLSIITKSNIEKFEEMNFLTFHIELDSIDGDLYKRNHLTYYVRQ